MHVLVSFKKKYALDLGNMKYGVIALSYVVHNRWTKSYFK